MIIVLGANKNKKMIERVLNRIHGDGTWIKRGVKGKSSSRRLHMAVFVIVLCCNHLQDQLGIKSGARKGETERERGKSGKVG